MIDTPDKPAPRDAERDRQRVQLLLNARLTYGKTPQPQRNELDTPLFGVAASPTLL